MPGDQGIGGKGQDVFVAAACMGAKPQPMLVQFVGEGQEGDAVVNLLADIASKSLAESPLLSGDMSVRTPHRCRTCITLVDASTLDATEIIEPTGAVTEDNLAELLYRVEVGP
jgi:fructose-1-phosphate kinase PfkB-like protein